jgi:SAM-dependent methyltransferase
MPIPKKRSPKKPKSRLTARSADRHVLYQESVQDTESEAAFLATTFRKLVGRPAESLREDFCGTALLCAEWVKKGKNKKDRTAVGIDLDASVLAWGTKHNLAPIGEPGNRVTLLRQNVLDRVPGTFDITVALNFSYFIFRTRDALRDYFRRARRTMKKDGLFFIDLYGGPESWRCLVESRRQKGFTYVWDQSAIDPITNSVTNHIHFRFPDGTKLRKAFTYEWRFWSIPELVELLGEAGFGKTRVYWEDGDDDGEGTGVFRPRTSVEQEAAFVAYIVAER